MTSSKERDTASEIFRSTGPWNVSNFSVDVVEIVPDHSCTASAGSRLIVLPSSYAVSDESE